MKECIIEGTAEISNLDESGIALAACRSAGNDRNLTLVALGQEKALGVDRIDGIDHGIQGCDQGGSPRCSP